MSRSIATFRLPPCIFSAASQWPAPTVLPAPLGRSAMRVLDWVAWRGPKKVEDAQRRELGLPEATRPWPQRITERGSLEIQAYDEVCYPGWQPNGRNGMGSGPQEAVRRCVDDGVAD